MASESSERQDVTDELQRFIQSLSLTDDDVKERHAIANEVCRLATEACGDTMTDIEVFLFISTS